MRPGFQLLFIIYLGLVVFFGLRFSRKMRTLEDFFLASRGLTASLVFLSLSASWFGATSILVSVDEAFASGISALWLIGLPAILTVLAFAAFLAGPIRGLNVLSVPDLVELRYGRVVRHLATLLIIWYMVLLAASQMVAVGQFLKLFLGVPYIWSLALGLAGVLCYLALGGLFSVVMTDVLQCFFLGAGVIGLAAFLWMRSPLSRVAAAAMEAGKTGYFDFFHDFSKNGLTALSFTLAWIVSPIAWQRIQAARSTRDARKGLVATAGGFIFLYGLVVLIGIFSLPLFFSRELKNPLVAELIASETGVVLGALLFMAVTAAILSTLDTAINTGALSLTRDVWQRIFSKGRANTSVAAGRWATLIIGAAAFLVATRFQSILKTIGLASEIMAEGFFIPGVVMIFMRKRAPLAGFLGLTLGSGYALAGFLKETGVISLSIPAWPSSLPYGLALSLAGFLIGLAWEFRRALRQDICSFFS